MTVIIGLTGGIASGKSTVSLMLKQHGFAIVDADTAARVVVEPGQEALLQIAECFGAEILNGDGTLNRASLGDIIFHDEEQRRKLNNIVHPAVRRYMRNEQEKAMEAGKKTIFLDIPLLFESNLTGMVEKTIVVYTTQETQLKRLMARNDFDEAGAKARIASQIDLDEKAARADAVIDNNGTLKDTEKQLEQLIADWNLVP